MTCTAFPCNTDGTPDFCGQDWQYGWDTTHNSTERFTRTEPVANELIVQDNVTGLVWQGCVAELKGAKCTVGSLQTKTWTDALTFCDGFNWAGYTDWRLPDRFELQSIADYGRSNLTIDITAFPATPGTEFFWSSSWYAGESSAGWGVSFYSGYVLGQNQTFAGYVRCVRNAPNLQPARFSKTEPAAGQPVVTDNSTSLVWQGCAAGLTGSACDTGSAVTYFGQNTLKYCEGLSWGNQADWRLPSVTELDSLVDSRRANPAIDTTAFLGTPSNTFWSSTWNEIGEWIVDFASGSVTNYGPGPGNPNTRCVRGGRFDVGCQDYGGRLGWMCNVPAGPFMMGCNSAVDNECNQTAENPYHSVNVPAFQIDRYEVTADQYKACVEGGGCSAANSGTGCNYYAVGKENHPINCVDWNQAKAFCLWAGKRLSSEAEWEKTARGTDGRKYPWGNDALDCDRAVHAVSPCSNSGTAMVGSKPTGVSPFGAMDMVGNVWEWVEDDYHSGYSGAPENGTAWVDTPRGTSRILRGGSFADYDTRVQRASYRFYGLPETRSDGTGFRCAKDGD
jgi:formylglycine-generating enzyme required for sulfatase activity